MKSDSTDLVQMLQQKYQSLSEHLTERSARLWAASEAQCLGRGGVSRVAEATKMSRPTIYRGLRELSDKKRHPERQLESSRVRIVGGGRKSTTQVYPKIARKLESFLNVATRGDPISPLKWTSKSCQHLSKELSEMGFKVSHQTVREILYDMGYSLQQNRKTIEGTQHADRDEQFGFISRKSARFIAAGSPVISVDTKKKENIGRYKNKGNEWHKKGAPEKVKTHDFIDDDLGKVSPYGVYDIHNNEGWVSVGIDHDTAKFATASIKMWWEKMGSKAYPHASEIYIVADGGGSNSSRSRLWKTSLQTLATSLGLTIHVSHFPPGTSKWNKIEHRMFCHITSNWRNQPLSSRSLVVNLIANTTTKQGLRIKAGLDKRTYKKAIKVSDDELADVHLRRSPFHGEWNYAVQGE